MGKGGRKRLSEKFDQELATRDDTLSTALAGAISLYTRTRDVRLKFNFLFPPFENMSDMYEASNDFPSTF